MAIKKEKRESATSSSSLLNELVEIVNKKGNEAILARTLTDSSEPPVRHWISTGSDILDFAISNRKHGGLPVGRIVEIYGGSSSGKSLIAAHILASTQRGGNIPIMIDTEYAMSPEFLQAIGVQIDNQVENPLMYVEADLVEDVFESIENIIDAYRKLNQDKILTIVVDSMAGATTKNENADDFDKGGYNTEKSIILSKAMRKITSVVKKEKILLVIINQVRTNMAANMPGMDKDITPGGKAVPFHSSVRIRLQYLGKIKNAKGDPIGVKTRATVVKNRIGPPFRFAEFDILFDRGILNYESWITSLIKEDIIKDGLTQEQKKKKDLKESDFGSIAEGSSKKYMFYANDGKIYEFNKESFVENIINNPIIKNEVYDKLADSLVMKYKDKNNTALVEIDDIKVGEDDDISDESE